MANKGVKGRIVFVGTDNGISNLTVTAVDFDPFFNEDDILSKGKTDANGNFELTYSHEDFTFWDPRRNPDIVVRVFGPRYAKPANPANPELFGFRLLHETKEAEDINDEMLNVGVIEIHPDNIDGWLVTHATLNPEIGTPVSLFQGNEIKYLVDGDTMFPAITDAAMGAKNSINLMGLLFEVKKGEEKKLITKFKSSFDPTNPPSSNCRGAMEATLEEELVKKALNPGGKLVNVMVNDKPLLDDTATEVTEFFRNTGVNTTSFKKGFAILHAKNMIVDGESAILMGSPLRQAYFNDDRHAIRDARHNGSLFHDVSLQVKGPAVAKIDKTFATVWKATGKPLTMITPDSIEAVAGENIASVQVLRTMPGGTFKATNPGDEDLPHGETGILEAYERAIINAERYIYIENQYFTSPEVVDALIGRMKDTSKPKLQIILVLNVGVTDLPGYPNRQVDIINQLKIPAEAHGHQLGIYTLWSRAEEPGSGGAAFEIMPIYVHSKLAIIDDKWATVGSANLDGTSMNYHEIGLIAWGGIFDSLIAPKFELGNEFTKFLWDAFWYVLFFLVKEILNLKIILMIIKFAFALIDDFFGTIEKIKETMSDFLDIKELLGAVLIRTSEHALPHRSRQPFRSVELNLVMYNGIAGQPDTTVIKQLRDQLWKEHLGLESLPPEMQEVPADPASMNWVETWNSRANDNLQAIKNDLAPAPSRTTRILAWTGDTNAEAYLRELKIRTKNLRELAHKFDFNNCKFDTKKQKPFSWPI